jgi:hypothetical protein
MGPFATKLPSFDAGAFTAAPSIASAFVPIVRIDLAVAPEQRSDAVTAAIHATARTEQAGEDNILAPPDRARRSRSQMERLGEGWIKLNRHLL